MAIPMLKIRRPLGRLIFNMGIATPGKTVFLIETAPWWLATLFYIWISPGNCLSLLDANPLPESLLLSGSLSQSSNAPCGLLNLSPTRCDSSNRDDIIRITSIPVFLFHRFHFSVHHSGWYRHCPPEGRATGWRHRKSPVVDQRH